MQMAAGIQCLLLRGYADGENRKRFDQVIKVSKCF